MEPSLFKCLYTHYVTPHSTAMKRCPYFRVELQRQRERAKCGQKPFGKRLLCWAQVFSRNWLASTSKLKKGSAPNSFLEPVAAEGSVQLLCLRLITWLRRARLLPSPSSLWFWLLFPVFYIHRWAPPLGASGLSWRCCTAHTAEACLPWDLATTTASTSWRAV